MSDDLGDYQDLIVTSEGGVATVAINRPKDDQLDAEVAKWCAEILERSPSAIAKRSFNADTESTATNRVKRRGPRLRSRY